MQKVMQVAKRKTQEGDEVCPALNVLDNSSPSLQSSYCDSPQTVVAVFKLCVKINRLVNKLICEQVETASTQTVVTISMSHCETAREDDSTNGNTVHFKAFYTRRKLYL